MEKKGSDRLGSGFASIPGLIVLAALILVAAFFRLKAAIAFLSALLLLSTVSFFWSRFSLARVKISTGAVETAAFPGEEMICPRTMKNDKLLPLIRLTVRIPQEEGSPVGPEDLSDAFSWVMGYESLEWKQKAKALHRGVKTVEELELVSGDGFGLSVSRKRFPLQTPFRFIVYPKIIPVTAGPILRSMRELEKTRGGLYTDPTLLSSTRPYREGDSFRAVNWRSLARGAELTTNVYEHLGMHRVCFVIDLGAFTKVVQVRTDRFVENATVVDEEALEPVFSLMASLALELEQKDVLCSFLAPDYGTGVTVTVPDIVSGESGLLLRAMAQVNYRAQECSLPLGEMDRDRHRLGQIYIFSRPEEQAWEKQAESLGLPCIKVADCDRASDGRVRLLPERELKP